MKSLLRFMTIIIFCLNINNVLSQSNSNLNYDQLLQENDHNNYGDIKSRANTDSTLVSLKKRKEYYTQRPDTLNLIECLIKLSDFERAHEDYSNSYNNLWEALLLAESKENDLELYKIHRRFSMLFTIFEKDDEALSHKQLTLKLCKKLIKESVLEEDKIISSYFSIAKHYSNTLDYEKAIKYLDSCQLINRSSKKNNLNNGFVLAELGKIKMFLGDYAQAEKLLNQAIEIFIIDEASYLIFAYAYLAELKDRQNLKQAAISNYLNCLESINGLNAHIDLRPDILDRLSKLYFNQNKDSIAYSYLKEAKSINDSLFNVKKIGSQLFSMRNKYKEAIDSKNEQLKNNELLLARESQSNLQLKVLISILLLIVVVVSFIVFNYSQKKKHLNEKREMTLSSKHEKDKAREILNVKNKELTAYTLQLIDKDRVVNELYQYIQTRIDEKTDLDHLKRHVAGNNKKMWEEFNTRFIDVNANFYANLRAKHPKLTPTERKYCALIKLKFSSKDMAQLLLVSLETVHITRHRLRKKMNLQQRDNLSNYIAEI
ncbi:tetratricopeptide repeat protein [Seonamhaeicola maritimus]|uniref:tetratricopeptide repeat protein n=1 Tax=Seonamhaeicola maritimus TaxID=2591822 RepID=UPI00249472E1|nr:hypothetical protein [Seonamhaeicola maritimus]